jgi:hypothetical protein
MLTLAALFAVGFVAIVAYGRVMRVEADDVPHGGVPSTAPVASQAAAPTQPAPAPVPADKPTAPLAIELPASNSPEIVKQLADAVGNDPQKRADAIVALGRAPREQAMPVLKQVLTSGTPADRPLALRSLRAIALRQGDADNRIRDALRTATYHSDDEAFTQSAQATLSDVEHAMEGRMPRG